MYKNVLVCGVAKSGTAAAKLLASEGANVTLQDIKPAEKLQVSLDALEHDGIRLYLGKNPDDILDEFDLVVPSPGIPFDIPFLEKARNLGIPVISEIELAYGFCKAPIVAITGTNGKTSTTTLSGQMIKAHNPHTEVMGNIGVAFSEHVRSLPSGGMAVLEVSTFQLEAIKHFRPQIAAIMNITPDHLDRHKTMERYRDLKYTVALNQTNEDYLILNFDDPLCRDIRIHAPFDIHSQLIFFSTKQVLDQGVYVDNGMIKVSGLPGTEGGVLDICALSELKIVGSHHYENALASVAISLCAGVPREEIITALRSFMGVAHRLEYVRTLNDIVFYNDSKATNTDASIKAIDAFADRPVVLIAGGYDKHLDFGDWVKTFAGRVKRLIVMGEVAQKIIDTCQAYGYDQIDRVNSLKDAVDTAYGHAVPGDCVLLAPACASWDMFDNFEQRGDMFKEYVMGLE